MKKLLLLFVVVILCVSSVSAAHRCGTRTVYESWEDTGYIPEAVYCSAGIEPMGTDATPGVYCGNGTPAEGFSVTGVANCNHTWSTFVIGTNGWETTTQSCVQVHTTVGYGSGGGGGGSVRKL